MSVQVRRKILNMAKDGYFGVTDMREHMDWLHDELANTTVRDRVEMYLKYAGEDFHEIYESLREQGDSTCPYYYEDYLTSYGQYYWRDSCTRYRSSTLPLIPASVITVNVRPVLRKAFQAYLDSPTTRWPSDFTSPSRASLMV